MTPVRQQTEGITSNERDESNDQEIHLPCEISRCVEIGVNRVDHPDRGELRVCRWHARQVRTLPASRWLGFERDADGARGAGR